MSLLRYIYDELRVLILFLCTGVLCRKIKIRGRLVCDRYFPDLKIFEGAYINSCVFSFVSGGSISIGMGSHIDQGVILRTYGGNISIGDGVSINPYSFIHGGGGVIIGNNTRIASGVSIISANHVFSSKSELLKNQGEEKIGIEIGSDVWIGTGARILDGVKIGNGSVIGAGAVVTKNTEAYGVYVGVPAKKIKERL